MITFFAIVAVFGGALTYRGMQIMDYDADTRLFMVGVSTVGVGVIGVICAMWLP